MGRAKYVAEQGHHLLVGAAVGIDSSIDREKNHLVIPGIDVDAALSVFDGNIQVFLRILQVFVDDTPVQAEKLDGYLREQALQDYSVTVHGIKGSCLFVGANAAAEQALALEVASKNGDLKTVKAGHAALLSCLQELVSACAEKLACEREGE
jgi:HPt (histidine-containing phosphotransfer) domain-containing protein